MYNVVAGDDFAKIARKVYGDDQQSTFLARSNPGIVEPLQVGSVLSTPPLPGAPTDAAPQNPSGDQDEVTLLINGQRFRFFTSVIITRALDSVSSISFSAPFEPDDATFRDTFRPFSFQPVLVLIGGSPLFTGTMLTPSPSVAEDGAKTVTVQCYGRPGVLSDCTPPASSFPVEYNEQTLREIAATICAPFGLQPIFSADAGAPFERVAIEPGQNVLDFLIGLAKQRGLVVSDTPTGSILFRAAEGGQPVAAFKEGSSPLISVEPDFRPQQYFSAVTGLEPEVVGTSGQQFTARNPHLVSAVRPHTFKVTDAVGGDVKTATEAKIGRMFGNAASYSITLNTWRTAAGDLWTPNTTVTLDAPGAMVYGAFTFLIRRVGLFKDDVKKTATLDLVLPEAFSAQIPGALPWDG